MIARTEAENAQIRAFTRRLMELYYPRQEAALRALEREKQAHQMSMFEGGVLDGHDEADRQGTRPIRTPKHPSPVMAMGNMAQNRGQTGTRIKKRPNMDGRRKGNP